MTTKTLRPFSFVKYPLLLSLVLGTLFIGPNASAQNRRTLTIDVNRPGTAISPMFYGLMTEEINYSYDGGLFAELIQNRTFQDPGPTLHGAPIHWTAIGSGKISVTKTDPVNAALPASLRLELDGGTCGVANDGFWGIPVRPNTKYTASFYARGNDGFSGSVTASLLTDMDDLTVAKGNSAPLTRHWKKHTITFTTPQDTPTTAAARFVLSATGSGSVDFSMVSLFPPTYQDHPGGLRPDLMKLMADLRPAFIRLPGGNYLEGNRFSDRLNWKQMIGPADHRPGHMGCWGYRSSDGFGLPEYLLWCKQLNAEPVLAVFAGYTLNGDHVDAGDPEMSLYVQEALDEIEYIAGPATSEWGKRRAADGFPEPFPLRYVEIGNEDWFDRSGSYDGRFTEIAKAIRARYPDIKLIATAPVTSFKPDLYDDHMYAGADATIAQWNRYDSQPDAPQPTFAGGGWSGRDQTGIKTIMGEWATQDGTPTGTLRAALADAVFVMGLERNSDAVVMQCYAPLFTNVNPENKDKGYPRGWQWATNLIGYDALRSFGSPSYHVLSAFGQNRGDIVLPATLEDPAEVKPLVSAPHGLTGVGTWRTDVEYKDIAVTTPEGNKLSPDNLATHTDHWKFPNDDWSVESGTIKPSTGDLQSWAIAGDSKWENYTVRLRARKLAGEEGFIVLWHAADTENYRWWNIGGWGNTVSRCELAERGDRRPYGQGTPFTVQTGRWYDLRLEVRGRQFRGFIDETLITEATNEKRHDIQSAYASASYAISSRDVIVKFVNNGPEPLETKINLLGAEKIDPRGTAIVLVGEPDAVNTIEHPNNVAPRKEEFSNASESFTRTFPPHSITVLRLSASVGK